MHRSRADRPPVITTAPPASGDGYDERRRKYAIMMASRAVCVLLAALTYRVSIWLALAFVIGGAVLPWCAVLIANDRPAKRRSASLGSFPPPERALPPAKDDDHHIVDG